MFWIISNFQRHFKKHNPLNKPASARETINDYFRKITNSISTPATITEKISVDSGSDCGAATLAATDNVSETIDVVWDESTISPTPVTSLDSGESSGDEI